MNKNQVKCAIFPVGGLGTRFLPVTKSMPKEMLPVACKPIIQHAFEEAKRAGIEKFIFVTGRNKNAINNHFDHAFELESNLEEKQKTQMLNQVVNWLPDAGNISFIRQQKPLGLGHAIWCARKFINDEPFAVILADEMILTKENYLKSMIDTFNSRPNSNIISVCKVEEKDVEKYGIIKNQGQKIIDMIEKPSIDQAPSNLAICGRYILRPEIFKYLEQTKQDKNGEIQLTNAMKSMLEIQDFYYQLYQGMRFDCGSQLGYLEANIAYALNDKNIQESVKKILKKYH